MLGHDLFFVSRFGTLSVARADEALGLVLLLFVAVVTAQLAEARRGAETAQRGAVARRSDEIKTALLRAVSHNSARRWRPSRPACPALRQPDAAYTDEDRAELLAAIEEEADRLDRLVGNLLDASRLEAGAWRIHKQPAGSARAGPQPWSNALAPGWRTAVDDEPGPTTCRWWRATTPRSTRCLTNLLENAAVHTPPGTPITSASRQGRGQVRSRWPTRARRSAG